MRALDDEVKRGGIFKDVRLKAVKVEDLVYIISSNIQVNQMSSPFNHGLSLEGSSDLASLADRPLSSVPPRPLSSSCLFLSSCLPDIR